MSDSKEYGKESHAQVHEEVVVLQASGKGKVRRDGKGFNIEADLTDAKGARDGKVIINWETHATADQLGKRPPSPKVQLDFAGPIPEVLALTRVQALWSFKDGSTLTAIGSGNSSVLNLATSALVGDRGALQITSGTGRFAGANGGVTINGSVVTPAGQQLFGNPGAEAVQNSVHTIRAVGGGKG
jgi:hypothetical protein